MAAVILSEENRTNEKSDLGSICQIATSLDKSLGGTVECIRQVSSGLQSAGYQVDVVSLSDDLNSRPIFSSNIRVIEVGARRNKYGLSVNLLTWMVRHIQSYDYVIINGLWQFHSLAAFLVASIRGVPFVVYTHGMLTEYCTTSKRIKKWVYWCLFEYWVLRSAKMVLCTSGAEIVSSRESLPGSSKLRFSMIGNGVEVPESAVNALSKDYSSKKNNHNSGDYLLFIGRIDPVKGIDTLIREYARNHALRELYRLVIVGSIESKYAQDLFLLAVRLGVGAAIEWAGAVYGDKKWELLARASALVLPSHHENFSIVAAEALAVGTPVLTTNVVGVSEDIVRYNAGLVSEDTADSFSRIIQQWILIPERDKKEMRINARRCYENEFRIDLPSSRIARVFQQIASERKR